VSWSRRSMAVLTFGLLTCVTSCTTDSRPTGSATASAISPSSALVALSPVAESLMAEFDACAAKISYENLACLGALDSDRVQPALHDALAKVMQVLPPDGQLLLSQSEASWESYLDSECRGEALAGDGGRDAQLFDVACTVEQTIWRIDAIAAWSTGASNSG
jgi:hypothetical protein